jgi:type IV pilus assembly protein PilZ
MHDERRRESRIPTQVLVEYELLEDFLVDYSANMSVGGMLIQTAQPLPVGTRFRLKFRLPDREKTVDTWGVVRWSVRPEDPGGEHPGMGVRFEGLSQEDRQAVEELLLAWG